MNAASPPAPAHDAGTAVPCAIAVLPRPGEDWDGFVRSHPAASVYALSGWSRLAQDVFGHRAYFIEARDAAGTLRGVLPLVHQKSLIFGGFLTSVPFFNYGGAVSASSQVSAQLMEAARALAIELSCKYLEFRDVEPRAGQWLVRTDKVSMILDLPGDAALLAKQLGAKLRSQIKRVDRESPAVRCGGVELLDDFYDVFCRNMRDLGTPVYPRKFFAAILERFPDLCQLVIVDRGNRPAAAGFLVFSNGRAEIPWAGCRQDDKPAGFNMKLYWEVLTAAIARGCTQFDFGRSTMDSGTYRFKKQWGARPLQLYWHRWEREPQGQQAARPAAEGRIMQYATAVWQRLPLPVANALGPLVSPSLPW
ncbi:MAG TPA: FemAB family XrtA/PEP-CTERM system-associated protein [Steroidobacter sp.]|uniref:FemAB family XrtA/PEP-CTERM system-associated protein n=1 Tax=Steroidobacter sp. TaxID=1978227 RepID=UPI002EDA9428